MATNNSRLILKDNTVHYRLYPDLSLIPDKSRLSDHLKDYIVDCYNKLSDLLKDYFWHFEQFNLHPVDASPSNQVARIEGTTCYEDNVEDEWFIVYLLIKLTQLDSRLVISVEDADGQFLLIEAADHLPGWADPDNTDSRVFIFNGEVHMIPPSVIPHPKNTDSTPIDITQALSAIRDESKKTKCSEKIQYSIRRRITMFPMQINNQKHRAQCFVPAGVATLLNHQPSLISWAVRAFYHRDPMDLKVIRSMKYFPPENRVKRNVTFTKCLYAQTVSQKFRPDPKVGWNLPPKESPLFKSYDLGIKIACGFEILISRIKNTHSGGSEQKVVTSVDSCCDKRWINMVKSLHEKGYFKENIPGSRRYKDLLNKAYDFYSSSMDFVQDSMDSEEEIGKRILKILKTVSVDYERLKREEISLDAEDPDDWMDMNQQKLENVLINQFSNSKDLNENLARTIPEVLQKFINFDEAGIEGAEVPGRESEWKPNGSQDLEPVKFDEDKFGDALKNILSFRLPSTESSSSSSGMSDYEMESGPDENDCSDSEDEATFNIRHSEITPTKRLSKIKKVAKRKKGKIHSEDTKNLAKEVKQYMEAMDRELDGTEVGKSFERGPNRNTSKPGEPPLATCDEDEDLDGTDTEDKQTLPPVDPELTALKNILESFDSQKGLPGPGSNLLSLMGVHLPRDSSPSQPQ